MAWGLIVGLGLLSWLIDGHTIHLNEHSFHVGWDRRPPTIAPWGWRLLAIFLPTVLALMLRPLPGGACVLLGLIVAALTHAVPPTIEGDQLNGAKPLGAMEIVLGGYRDPTVWLVLAAYLISRALIKTGLARRIALTFVRWLGHNTLGLSYAIIASDTLLAGMIPSNAARVGGVLLPITKSMSELYQSRPGPTPRRLGSFLMLALYQADVMACALFITGQASNWIASNQARTLSENLLGEPILLTYANWFWYALAPAAICLLCIPALVYRIHRPVITQTPAAAEFATNELRAMGRPSRSEWIVILVFLAVCAAWIWDAEARNTAIIALCGVAVLLLTRVLTWHDAITEKGAWDVFIWYGGLVQMGKLLDKAGVFRVFAEAVVARLEGWHVAALFLGVLLTYFYAHYAFASITTHILSMYPAFTSVLIAAGAPPMLVLFSFAYFANFSAGLTHYGTTPAPIIFGLGYVSQRDWWRVGLLLSVFNVTVWLTVGMGWWKVLGLW